MQRTYVRRRIVVGIAAIALGVLGVTAMARGAQAGAGLRPVAEHRYVVQPGDTLWGIATSLAPQHDPRAVIDDIVHENGVPSGEIVPGQVLVIPPST